MQHEPLYKDFSGIVGDSFPVLDSPSLPAGKTAHEDPERVTRAAAKGYSLKCSGSAVEWARGSSEEVQRRVVVGGGRGRERGDSRQVPRYTMMPVPFRWTAGEVPAGSGRGEARSAGGGGRSASTPQPPPAERAVLATAAAAVAEAQLPPRPQKAPQTINPAPRRDEQKRRIVHPTL